MANSGFRCSGVATLVGVRGATAPAPRVAPPQRTRDNGPMTRSELIHRIAQKQSQFVERDVEFAVKMMLNQMAECLVGGGRIEIRGFASFTLRLHRARVARNPKTGTPVSLPARYAAYFKPGKKLRERVNRELSEAQHHSGESEDPTVRFGQCPEIDARDAQP